MRYYTVKDHTLIPGLNITGPLTEPSPIPYAIVLSMVKKGYTVYEHNPVNKSEKVLLTLENVTGADFKSTRPQRILKEARLKIKQEEDKPVHEYDRTKNIKQTKNANNNNQNKQNSKSLSKNNDKSKDKPLIQADAFTK